MEATQEQYLRGDRHGFLPAPGDLPDDQQDRVRVLTDGAFRPLVDTTLEEMQKIDKDRGLNDLGRREKRDTVRGRAAAAIDTVTEKQIKPLQRSLDYERPHLAAEWRLYKSREFINRDASGNPTSLRVSGERAQAQDAAAQREIRDRMLTLPPEQRAEIAREAARSNDLTTLRAIHSAPKSFPVVSPDVWEEVDRLHIERHHADEFKTVRNLERTIQSLRWNMMAAKKTLGITTLAEPKVIE